MFDSYIEIPFVLSGILRTVVFLDIITENAPNRGIPIRGKSGQVKLSIFYLILDNSAETFKTW